ncbi:MAG: extracellular solute-binding protein [Rhodobacteraceae bacterium]|nr:MAG: extracellular solute-binding protein [Paracoccaceae bacterium]
MTGRTAMRQAPAVAFAACAAVAGGPATAADPVAVYNWSAYAAEDALAAFERETGMPLRYETYGEGGVAETRLGARGSGYDVAVVSSEYLRRLIRAGALKPLAVEAPSDLYPMVMERLAPLDPDHVFALPYFWGMTGIAVDTAALAARAPDAPADSWSLLFDPAYVSRFTDCGVALLDSPEESVAAALLWLGLDPDSEAPEDVAAAIDALAAVAPHVTHFTSEHVELLEEGAVCLAMTWNTDLAEAGDRYAFITPTEGALLWVDVFVMPVDAPNPEGGRRFIETMLRPEISALNTNAVLAANAVSAATAMLDAAVRDDPTIYPPADKMARLVTLRGRDPEAKRAVARAWTRLKLGMPN